MAIQLITKKKYNFHPNKYTNFCSIYRGFYDRTGNRRLLIITEIVNGMPRASISDDSHTGGGTSIIDVNENELNNPKLKPFLQKEFGKELTEHIIPFLKRDIHEARNTKGVNFAMHGYHGKVRRATSKKGTIHQSGIQMPKLDLRFKL